MAKGQIVDGELIPIDLAVLNNGNLGMLHFRYKIAGKKVQTEDFCALEMYPESFHKTTTENSKDDCSTQFAKSSNEKKGQFLSQTRTSLSTENQR